MLKRGWSKLITLPGVRYQEPLPQEVRRVPEADEESQVAARPAL